MLMRTTSIDSKCCWWEAIDPTAAWPNFSQLAPAAAVVAATAGRADEKKDVPSKRTRSAINGGQNGGPSGVL